MYFVAFLALFSMLLLSISSLAVCQGAVTPLSFQQATGSSPWTGRALAFSTVVYVPLDLGFISVPLIAGGAESIGLIYGDSGATRYASDVWVAMDSLGATWTQKSATAPWSGRSVGGLINVVTNPSNPVMGAQILVLIGGRNSTGLLNDVWSSTDLGSSWQLLNSSLQTVISPREQFGLVIAPGFDNRTTVNAYLIGGYGIGDGGGVVSLNDVYFTRGMGTMPWLPLTSKAGVPWSPRSAFSIASDDLQIVIAGGILDSGAPTNDVWILGLFSDLIWIRSTPALPASGWNALINTRAPKFGPYYAFAGTDFTNVFVNGQ